MNFLVIICLNTNSKRMRAVVNHIKIAHLYVAASHIVYATGETACRLELRYEVVSSCCIRPVLVMPQMLRLVLVPHVVVLLFAAHKHLRSGSGVDRRLGVSLSDQTSYLGIAFSIRPASPYPLLCGQYPSVLLMCNYGVYDGPSGHNLMITNPLSSNSSPNNSSPPFLPPSLRYLLAVATHRPPALPS